MSNLSEQELEEGLFEKEHVLSLPYFRSVRLATDLMVSRKVSAVAMYLYNYIAHNTNTTSGISHRIKIKDLAKYVDKSISRVSRSLKELADAGLIVIRSKCPKSGWVFYLPCIEHAARAAKKTAIQAEERKELSELDAEIDRAIKKIEKEKEYLMDFLPDELKLYGPADYLPNATPEFIDVIPELYKIDIQVYFILAANIVDFVNFKTLPITPKEISEKLNKSHSSICNSISRLKSTTLPHSRKPLVIQERDAYILPDFQHASMMQDPEEQFYP